MGTTNNARSTILNALSQPHGLALALAVSTGCQGALEGPLRPGQAGGDAGGLVWNAPADAGASSTNPNWAADTGTPNVQITSCADYTVQTEDMLDRYCARCHGDVGSGGLANISDVDALIRTGRVVPGNPDSSPLYRRTSGGTMPPSGAEPRPDQAAITAMREWISCGAPAFAPSTSVVPNGEPPTIDAVMRWIQNDLRRYDNRAQRLNKRYIVLTNTANAGASDAELTELRDAVDVLVNHLSTGLRVVSPTPIDRDRTVLRIDLDDYGWDANTWNRIVANYPFFVQYDDNSAEFPFDQSAQEFIQDETGEAIPFVFADWLVAYASQPPLYYDVLGLPGNVNQLYQQLGIDFQGDAQVGDFVRAGFAVSGVSNSNRMIQRNAAPGGTYAWTTFDFASSAADGNIFQNPVDFQFDGGEIIFSLPNGLQGYYIANAAGVRQNAAPQAVVTDPRTPDNSVIAGMSCMGCHDADGVIARDDELRAHVIANLAGGAERDLILRTHPPNDLLAETFDRDSASYTAARRLIGEDGTVQPVPETAIGYLEGDQVIDQIAARLWLPAQRVRDAIMTDISLSLAFRNVAQGGRIAREELEDQFDDIVCSIGVGQPVCTASTLRAPCGCAQLP